MLRIGFILKEEISELKSQEVQCIINTINECELGIFEYHYIVLKAMRLFLLKGLILENVNVEETWLLQKFVFTTFKEWSAREKAREWVGCLDFIVFGFKP